MSKDNGGPAFPNITPDMNVPGGPGMSLRQWFAGQALKGKLSNDSEILRLHLQSTNPVELLVKSCYVIADAMIKESNP